MYFLTCDAEFINQSNTAGRPCSFFSCFSIPLSIVITSLVEEGACVLLVHLFVCFVRVNFCYFSLPPGFRGWLQFMIVALLY